MKKTIAIMGGIILSVLAMSTQAQTDPIKPVQTDTLKQWDPKKNPAVSDINAKYKEKYVASRPASTTEDIYPALGKYESSINTDAASVTITLDAENRGMVWIEGLPQGKVKAMLRKSPAIYKIPAQKTEDGKDIAEGTLIFDKETNTLRIVIGKNFDTGNPSAVFTAPAIGSLEEEAANTEVVVKNKSTKTKTKTKVKKPEEPKAWIYTGTKVEKATVMN